MSTSSLFHIPEPRPTARLRLVCFSYAGGNCSHFLHWQPDLHPEAELVLCQLPGRGSRSFEPCSDDLELLVRDMSTAISELVDKPLVMFGHGLGAKLAYLLAQAMQRRALGAPLHTIISAAVPPLHRCPAETLHKLPDREFIAAAARTGATPAQILRNAELIKSCLPALRADYKLMETPWPAPRQVVVGQLTLLGGTDDPCVSVNQLSDWAPLYDSVIETFLIEGGHFFIHDHSEQVLRFLNDSVLEFNLRRMDRRRPYFDVAL